MANRVNLDITEKLNITCRRGDTFSLGLVLKDSSGTAITLATSGYEFFMQVRSLTPNREGARDLIMGTDTKGEKADRDGVSTNFSFTVDDSGNLTISASSSIMRLIPAGEYVYDLQQIVNDVSTTLFEGRFKVNDEISDIQV